MRYCMSQRVVLKTLEHEIGRMNMEALILHTLKMPCLWFENFETLATRACPKPNFLFLAKSEFLKNILTFSGMLKKGDPKCQGCTWRIIPVSKWLITIVSKSPK